MGFFMFNARKPRGFQHNYIYVDERKEKLKQNAASKGVQARGFARQVLGAYQALEKVQETSPEFPDTSCAACHCYIHSSLFDDRKIFVLTTHHGRYN